MKITIPSIFMLLSLTVPVFAQSDTNSVKEKLKIAPILGMQALQDMPDAKGVANAVAGTLGFSVGMQGQYAFSEKIACGFLAQGVYGVGAKHPYTDLKYSVIDIELEPQIVYKPIPYASVYIGLNNRINAGERIEQQGVWIDASRKINNQVVDMRLFAPYELRGKIGVRGYGKDERTFLDFSYIYGFTEALSNFIIWTNDAGEDLPKGSYRNSGFRLSVGYFIRVK